MPSHTRALPLSTNIRHHSGGGRGLRDENSDLTISDYNSLLPLSSSLSLSSPTTHVQKKWRLSHKKDTFFKTLFLSCPFQNSGEIHRFQSGEKRRWGEIAEGEAWCDEVSTATLEPTDFALMYEAKTAAIFFSCCLFLFFLSDGVKLLCWFTFHLKQQGTF